MQVTTNCPLATDSWYTVQFDGVSGGDAVTTWKTHGSFCFPMLFLAQQRSDPKSRCVWGVYNATLFHLSNVTRSSGIFTCSAEVLKAHLKSIGRGEVGVNMAWDIDLLTISATVDQLLVFSAIWKNLKKITLFVITVFANVENICKIWSPISITNLCRI